MKYPLAYHFVWNTKHMLYFCVYQYTMYIVIRNKQNTSVIICNTEGQCPLYTSFIHANKATCDKKFLISQ